MIPGQVRAVFFDAVGTLLHPQPDAATVYAEVGRRFGSRLSVQAIRPAFAAAFVRQEQRDRAMGWKTSEAREVERWRSIVGEVLHDVADSEACFAALYEHFSLPQHWRCDAAAETAVGELRRRGYDVGIGSNYDHRLRTVIAGFPALATAAPVIISAEVGWRKPAREFFAALCSNAALNPQEILYVGDDLVNDYQGAVLGGCRALLVRLGDDCPRGTCCVADLRQILTKGSEHDNSAQ